jgi:hypothetical protein
MSKERSTQLERFYLKACEMVALQEIASGDQLTMSHGHLAKMGMSLAVEMQQCYLEKKFSDEQWWAENEDEMKAMWEQAQIEKWENITKEKANGV